MIRLRFLLVFSALGVPGLLADGGAVFAAPPPCKPNDPPTWCDPKMVALKLQDAAGTLDIRLEAGGPVAWKRTAWNGRLDVQADRVASGALRITVWVPGVEAPVKTAVIRKGEAVVLRPGKEVPAGYFGPSNQPAKFIADE